MAKQVRVNTAYFDTLMEALKFAPPQIQALSTETAEQVDYNGLMTERIRKKLYENEGMLYFEPEELTFAYDAVVNYKKYLKKQLPLAKKGSAQYNKTKKALDTLPRIFATFFSTIVTN